MKNILLETKPDSCVNCEFYVASDSERPWRAGKCYMFMVLVPGTMGVCCSRSLSSDDELKPKLKAAHSTWYAENYHRKYKDEPPKRNVVPNLQNNLPLIP